MGGRPRARGPDPPCPADAVSKPARETARLTALSVRSPSPRSSSASCRIRQPDGVATERLPTTPSRVPSRHPDTRPYRSRPRAELAKLLHSTSSSPERPARSRAGAPRARRGRHRVRSPASRSARRGGASALRRAPRPSRRSSYLAAALGAGSDPRVPRLRERLGRRARRRRPSPRSRLPPDPPRAGRGGLDRWTASSAFATCCRIRRLLAMARVPRGVGVAIDGGPVAGPVHADVPDVEALSSSLPALGREVPRLRALRIALWVAIAGLHRLPARHVARPRPPRRGPTRARSGSWPA